jgi:ubiquinone/menaquinone biosynthesis C-methylase UbiE
VGGDVVHLPIQEASFDFAFSINTLHHLGDRASVAALAEVARVLKPGARFFLHEKNARNPLSRFYLGYVYPIVRRVDEGTELWLPSTVSPCRRR